MGNEALVDYAEGRTRARVRAHLDGQHLQLSGERKLKLPLSQVRTATAAGGVLKIDAGELRFSLTLGEGTAALWARKILNPPSLASKLGIKPGMTVALVGKFPPEILKAAGSTAHSHARMPATLPANLTLVALPLTQEEATIKAVAARLKPGAATWFVYEKGTPFNGDMVIASARKAGLKDTKVSRVSETHAALRFITGAKA